MRLIDADALKYRREDYGGYDDVGVDERKRGILYLLEKDVAAAPTIEPVKHGKWIYTEVREYPVGFNLVKCSSCDWCLHSNPQRKMGPYSRRCSKRF